MAEKKKKNFGKKKKRKKKKIYWKKKVIITNQQLHPASIKLTKKSDVKIINFQHDIDELLKISNEIYQSTRKFLIQKNLCILPDIINTDKDDFFIDTKKALHIFQLAKNNIFIHPHPIYPNDASTLLSDGYKSLTKYGSYCPVCYDEHDDTKLMRLDVKDCLYDEVNSFPISWQDYIVYTCCMNIKVNLELMLYII